MADDQEQTNTMAELFGSESEDEQPPQPKGDDEVPKDQMQAIFGSDDDDEQEPGTAIPGSDARVDASGAGAPYNDELEVEAEPQAEPEPEEEEEDQPRGPPMHIAAPLHPILNPATLQLVKLSNIVSIEHKPFDPEAHEPGGTEYIDERGHKRIRLHDTNAMRWRWTVDAQGNAVRDSNARLVRWSDGSVTVHIGEEVMDVREIDITRDNTFLFTRFPNIIQGQGPLQKKLTLRPASLTSASHKRLAKAVEKQHGGRQSKVRHTTTIVDPRKQKEKLEKEEEARIRDIEKLQEKQQKQMKRQAPNRYQFQQHQQQQRTLLNAAYLEEEEEEEDELDDGFIVRDEDDDDDEEDEEMGEEGGRGRGREEEEGEEEEDDEREMLARPRVGRREDEEAAAARLQATKNAPPPTGPSPVPGVLLDSDDEKEKGGGEGAEAKKQQRLVMMESDSE